MVEGTDWRDDSGMPQRHLHRRTGPDGVAAFFTLGQLCMVGRRDDGELRRARSGGGEDGEATAEEGVRLACEAGLKAEPHVTEASGPVWEAVVDSANRVHARQPTLIIHGV